MRFCETLTLALSVTFICCTQRPKEPTPHVANESVDTVSKHQAVRRRSVDPLPEADTTHDQPFRLLPIKPQDSHDLIDSLRIRRYHFPYERQKIDDALVSPTGKYIACGFWGEKSGNKVSFRHLIVIEAGSGKVVRSTDSPSDCCIIMHKWISKSRLLFTTNDGFFVGLSYVYDAFRDSLQIVSDPNRKHW